MTTTETPQITVDPEFQQLIPPLRPQEYAGLEASIAAEGCRDPLVVWQGKGLLLDGHNRHRICTRYGLPYRTVELAFNSREEAKSWILDNQAHRRNLNDSQRFKKKAEIDAQTGQAKMAKTQFGADPAALSSVDKADGPHNTQQIIADELGWSTGKTGMADVVDKHATPEVKQALAAGEITIRKAYADITRETKRQALIAKLTDMVTQQAKAIEGVYDVVVLDPPWPMEMIISDVRPHQVGLTYPTMTEDQLTALPVAAHCAEDCHVWVWTTQKFRAMAERLLTAWGLTYVCTFVWHKDGGFQPFNLPKYNCEFVLYAHKGNPRFVDLKDFNVCFSAPVGSTAKSPRRSTTWFAE